MQNVDRMLYATERARSLDIKPTDSTYVTAIPVILLMAESTWKRKVELYKKFGWTKLRFSKLSSVNHILWLVQRRKSRV